MSTPNEALSPEIGALNRADLVVEFLNTLRMARGEPVDLLQTDHDVKTWIEKRILLEKPLASQQSQGTLLRRARRLRQEFRAILNQVQSGTAVEPDRFSAQLAQASSRLQVVRRHGRWFAQRVYKVSTVNTLLSPLIEAFVELLLTSQVQQVRPCQASDCILWFRDTDRGTRKRFCSEKICGTRARVAAHRARHAQ